MIFDAKIARKLEVLIHPDVETALLLMFEYMQEQESSILRQEDAKIEQLKLFQGKYLILQELKDYKQRIHDAIENT